MPTAERLHETSYRHRQQLIGPVADDNILRFTSMEHGQLFAQRLSGWVWVQTQPRIGRRFDGPKHASRWRIGILVRVQLDQPLDLRLLARNVRMQSADERTNQPAAVRFHQIKDSSIITIRASPSVRVATLCQT